MNVYLLIEEREQEEFKDDYDDTAYPASSVVGVYADKNHAEYEKEMIERQIEDDKRTKEIANYSYLIEERPVL